jgi:hypothetical protein
MAREDGTNKVKMRKARWASPMVKPVEAALRFVNRNISSVNHIVAMHVI